MSEEFRNSIVTLEEFYPGISDLKEELLTLAYPEDREGTGEFRAKFKDLTGIQLVLLYELLSEYKKDPSLKIKVPYIALALSSREQLDYPDDFLTFAKRTRFANKMLKYIKEVMPVTSADYLSDENGNQELMLLRNILICLEIFANDLPFLEFIITEKVTNEERLKEQFTKLLADYISTWFELNGGQIIDKTLSKQINIAKTNIDFVLGIHYLPYGLKRVIKYYEDGKYKITIPPHNETAIFAKTVLSSIILEALREAFPNATFLFNDNLDRMISES